LDSGTPTSEISLYKIISLVGVPESKQCISNVKSMAPRWIFTNYQRNASYVKHH